MEKKYQHLLEYQSEFTEKLLVLLIQCPEDHVMYTYSMSETNNFLYELGVISVLTKEMREIK